MEISKFSVVDSRILQEKPAYAVEKGALSLTNAPFQAISKSVSQHTFNIQVPSLNVFVNREFEWSCDAVLALDVGIVAGTTATANRPILSFGVDTALCPYPLHSLISTQTATINDAVVSLNVADTLSEIVRLVDRPENRAMKTSPSMLDEYASYTDDVGQMNSVLAGYGNALDPENVPNGAWEVVFTDPTGDELTGNGTYDVNGITMTYVDGVPVETDNNAGGTELNATQYVFVKFQLTEKLVLSPFIFNEECGDETGFYGINNIQVVMNMNAVQNRIVRCGKTEVASITGKLVKFPTSVMNVEFMTPNLSVPLPSSNVVPYMEYPRYITPRNVEFLAGALHSSVATNTFTLPQIPDAFIIYAKRNNPSALMGDYYLPIEKCNINFNNFAGLLSSHTKQQLYRMSYANGLKMDYLQFSGKAQRAEGLASSANGTSVSTTGGFLVLKPARDITLQAGESAGLVGNYTFQANLDIRNNAGDIPAGEGYSVYVVAVNSGFFETQSGSSRIVKGVLTESEIINATMLEYPSRSQMERVIGGGFLSKLGNALNKAKGLLAKPEVREMLKQGARLSGNKMLSQGADIADAVGLGVAGAGRTGGRKSKKAQLSALY